MNKFKCKECGKNWHSTVELDYRKDKTCDDCSGELTQISMKKGDDDNA